MTSAYEQAIVVDIRALRTEARTVAGELEAIFPVLKSDRNCILIDSSKTSPGKVKDTLKRILHRLAHHTGFRVLANQRQVHVVLSERREKHQPSKRVRRRKGSAHVAGAFCPHCGKFSTSGSDYWTHVGMHYVGFRA